jgi:hypothetical protein
MGPYRHHPNARQTPREERPGAESAPLVLAALSVYAAAAAAGLPCLAGMQSRGWG